MRKRNYKKEYEDYHAKPEQKKRRAERNASRRKLQQAGKVTKGDGKDVHHRNYDTSDQSASNLVAISASKNRSDNRKRESVDMLSESWSVNDLNALIKYFESKAWQTELNKALDYSGEKFRIAQAFKKHKIKFEHKRSPIYIHNVVTEESNGVRVVLFIRPNIQFLATMPKAKDEDQYRAFSNLVDEYTGRMKKYSDDGPFTKLLYKMRKGTDSHRYFDGRWVVAVLAPVDSNAPKKENINKINEVKIKQDRYIRNHGKPLRVSGTTTIAFTNKQSGDVNYKNPKEFFSPKSGNKSDVMKQAKEWAKNNGHDTIYIMENTTMKLTKTQLKEMIREEIKNLTESYTPSYPANVSTFTIGGGDKGLTFFDPAGRKKYVMKKDEWEDWLEMNSTLRNRFVKIAYKKSKPDTDKQDDFSKYLSRGGRVWD